MGDSRSKYWDDYESCRYCGCDITYSSSHLCHKNKDASFMKLKDGEDKKFGHLKDASVEVIDATINFVRGDIRKKKDEIRECERYIDILEYFKHVNS